MFRNLIKALILTEDPDAGDPKDKKGAPFVKGEGSTWVLTLPGGQELTVRFDVVPTHACDHRYQVNAYQPGDRLRRLVQV